ncbi:MAG: glutaminyl-peptide cyclotransferase [bacterium]|nr:glutaminyl-peptide cyclotransferase [bacterium]
MPRRRGKIVLAPSRLQSALVVLAWLVCQVHASAEPPPGNDGTASSGDATVERLAVKVLAEYPHDPRAFTQGLVWHDGVFYESTGNWGVSTIRRVDPATGEVLASRPIDPGLFGEGLAVIGNQLIQVTWKAGLALVYDAGNLLLIDQLAFQGEGWGLAYDGKRLVMSDGSSWLSFRDPADLKVLSKIEVKLAGEPLRHLNELEHVGDALYANVWGEDRIVRIDPRSGAVTALIEASGLLSLSERRRVGVLNGIAYDPESKSFWITGKYWPKMFQVIFVPAADSTGR